MNILLLAKDSHVGGLVKSTYNLAHGLSLMNNIVVIGISPSDAIESLKPYNLHEIDFDTKSPLEIVKNYWRIARLVKKYRIEIIQAQNRLPALYAWLYCTFHRNVKYTWASLVAPIPSSFIHRITTKYGFCATTSSTDEAKFLMEALKIPQDKVKVIYQGIDLWKCTKTSTDEQAALRNKIGIKEGEKLILLYGRLNKIKGHEFLLDSLRLLNNTNYKVVFPGENQEYKNHLMDIIKKYNLEERIIFPGYINGSEYLSITDLMVLPSLKEGLSLAFLETISMGVPVIRTKTGGYEDVKDLCFGVDYGDVNRLAQLIDDCLNGSEIFPKRAEIAKKESYRFSVENMVNNYYNLYCTAIDKKSC